MSIVTGVTLISQCCDEFNISTLVVRLNEWIAKDSTCSGGKLLRLDSHYGGTKHPEVLVYGGGFNYLSWPKFIDFARSLPWRSVVTLPDETKVLLIVSPDQMPAQVVILN